jgi:hypothetical protein
MNDPRRVLRGRIDDQHRDLVGVEREVRVAFAEYITHPTSAETGRKVHHLLMGRIVVDQVLLGEAGRAGHEPDHPARGREPGIGSVPGGCPHNPPAEDLQQR